MWEYRASLLEVLDGDTIRVLADVGFYGRAQVDLRLSGVHAPEKNEPGGFETKRFVEAWCDALPDVKWPLTILTLVTSGAVPVEQRTFTRYVAEVWSINDEYLNEAINVFLLQHPEWGGGI